jgi:hypothetical protein
MNSNSEIFLQETELTAQALAKQQTSQTTEHKVQNFTILSENNFKENISYEKRFPLLQVERKTDFCRTQNYIHHTTTNTSAF